VDFSDFHFNHPSFLWLGMIIPCIWVFYFFFRKMGVSSHQLEKYIDKHLLPYLLLNKETKTKKNVGIVLWSMAWFLLVLSLAGPRWNYREIELLSDNQSLVLLLDVSESMNAADVKPTRLARAKQKIEDLFHFAQGVKIGLIAFAADPHMISPITDDHQMMISILPSLTTDLVYVQGSRLSPALDMAGKMLEAEPGESKAVVILSDGGFEDTGAMRIAKELANQGISIYTFGIGSPEGILLQPKHRSNTATTSPVWTKLEKERLHEISRIGNGRYLESRYGSDEKIIIDDLKEKGNERLNTGVKKQIWEEHFYVFLLPVLPIFLWWFRQGYVISLFIIFFSFGRAYGIEYENYFLTKEEQGKKAYEEKDYVAASTAFQDPYRKGIAYYRSGNYEEAEKMFLLSSRPEVAAQALYNLGNTYVQQNNLTAAVKAYEDVLTSWPDHTKAKENLAIVKKMLEEEKNQSDSSDEKQEDNDEKKDNKENKDQQQQNTKDNQKDNQQDSQDTSQDNQQDEQRNEQKNDSSSEEIKEEYLEQQNTKKNEKSAEEKQLDEDANLWLDRIANDPQTFLKNKFYIESKRNGTKESHDPW